MINNSIHLLFLFLFIRIFYMILNDGFKISSFYKRRKFVKTEAILIFMWVSFVGLVGNNRDLYNKEELALFITLAFLFLCDYFAITKKISKIFYFVMVIVSLFIFSVTYGRYIELSYYHIPSLYVFELTHLKKIYETPSTETVIKDKWYKYIKSKNPNNTYLLLTVIPMKYPRLIPAFEKRLLWFYYADSVNTKEWEHKYVHRWKCFKISYKESKYPIDKLIKIKFNNASAEVWRSGMNPVFLPPPKSITN